MREPFQKKYIHIYTHTFTFTLKQFNQIYNKKETATREVITILICICTKDPNDKRTKQMEHTQKEKEKKLDTCQNNTQQRDKFELEWRRNYLDGEYERAREIEICGDNQGEDLESLQNSEEIPKNPMPFFFFF